MSTITALTHSLTTFPRTDQKELQHHTVITQVEDLRARDLGGYPLPEAGVLVIAGHVKGGDVGGGDDDGDDDVEKSRSRFSFLVRERVAALAGELQWIGVDGEGSECWVQGCVKRARRGL